MKAEIETCGFDEAGTLWIDDPRIEAKLMKVAERLGISAEDALERALDNLIAEDACQQT